MKRKKGIFAVNGSIVTVNSFWVTACARVTDGIISVYEDSIYLFFLN